MAAIFRIATDKIKNKFLIYFAYYGSVCESVKGKEGKRKKGKVWCFGNFNKKIEYKIWILFDIFDNNK